MKKKIITIEELEERKNELQNNKLPLLNEKQQIGLRYYKPLMLRISRKEIVEFEKLFVKLFELVVQENGETIENHKFQIVGSYRRGAKDSGDIDIIFTSLNDNKLIFDKFIDKLLHSGDGNGENILLHLLSRGPTKSLTIGKLPLKDAIPRRLDFLYTSLNEFPFALLYFTGSKDFNTAMRQHALNLGLTLNEHGFHKINKTKTKEAKIDATLFTSEKDIFDYLGMVYKEPF